MTECIVILSLYLCTVINNIHVMPQVLRLNPPTPFQVIDGHVTHAQRSQLRLAVIMRCNAHTPEEADYLVATFCDEERATAYAKTCFFYTGVSHIVQPLNP